MTMRLSIEVSPEQHQLIKAMAAMQGRTIRDLVLDKIFTEKETDEEADWQELVAFLGKRITNAESAEGKPTKTLDQIAEQVLQRHNAL